MSDKLQLALLVGWALPGNKYFENDERLHFYAQGGALGDDFVKKAASFDLLRPKHPDAVLKKREIDIDWKSVNPYVCQWLLNGFVNYGYGDDLLLNSHISRGSACQDRPEQEKAPGAAANPFEEIEQDTF